MKTKEPLPKVRPRAFRIQRHDSSTRWLVQSAALPEEWYLCDLMANHQIGRCTCPDFTFNKEPVARLVRIPSDDLRCKHLRAVREYLLNSLLQEIGKNEMNKSNE
jgi:hypothetical protein